MVRVKESYNIPRKGTGRADNLGKTIAFPTDAVDIWGNLVTLGNAELVARLGGMNTFDRRGSVVWMDDFEGSTLKWISAGSPGGIKYLSNINSLYGDQSLYVETPATTDNFITLIRSLPLPTPVKLGLQFSFLSYKNQMTYGLSLDVYDGSKYYYAELLFDDSDNTLKLRLNATDWVTLATGLDTFRSYNNFNTFKSVIDIDAGKWVRILMNNTQYDVSAYDLWSNTSEDAAHIELRMTVKTKEDAANYTWIDGVIFTQDEP